MARILIVEDDADIATAYTAIMATEGHEVDVAQTAGRALIAAREHTPDCSVVDLRLPDGSGYHVIRRLRERPDTRFTGIIAISGFPDNGAAVKAFDVGADYYLAKPIAVQDLLVRVRYLLRLRAQARISGRAALDMEDTVET